MTQTYAHRLANNMLILVREARNAPVAASALWYRVGSRNERMGLTGISHWVEHMLFKGTASIPAGELDRLVARNGGTFNAFTSHDYTAYYETLPADRIALALQIESDRMANALFDTDEVERERTVILAEREGHENDPDWWLNEAVMAAAFQIHPYRNDVIGWTSDLHSITRDDLYRHYQTYYMPNNAVLALVGDFDAATMLDMAERTFGDLPVGPPIPAVNMSEPQQQGERRVTILRPGAAPYVQIVYHTPDCRHSDFAAMVVLDAVLSGAKPLGFGGGSQTNRSARLYRALVETQLASYTGSSYGAAFDPFLLELYANVQEDRSTEQIEQALLAEVEKVRRESVTEQELQKVRKQVRAQVAYSSESVTSQALSLGLWEVLDSYTRIDRLLDELATVTAEDVQKVAQLYLAEENRTVGHFIPTT